jgi:hypothetical protein
MFGSVVSALAAAAIAMASPEIGKSTARRYPLSKKGQPAIEARPIQNWFRRRVKAPGRRPARRAQAS